MKFWKKNLNIKRLQKFFTHCFCKQWRNCISNLKAYVAAISTKHKPIRKRLTPCTFSYGKGSILSRMYAVCTWRSSEVSCDRRGRQVCVNSAIGIWKTRFRSQSTGHSFHDFRVSSWLPLLDIGHHLNEIFWMFWRKMMCELFDFLSIDSSPHHFLEFILWTSQVIDCFISWYGDLWEVACCVVKCDNFESIIITLVAI